MKKAILLLLITSVLWSLGGCSKDATLATALDQLPQVTTTGANTAGYIINGKILIPKNGSASFAGSSYGLRLNYGGNFYPDKNDFWQLHISNNKDSENNFGIVLYIKNMNSGNGIYNINQSNGQLSSSFNINQIIAGIKTNGLLNTYYSSNDSGAINITRSDLGYGIAIFSGTFSCTLYNKDNTSETIQVTDGRFDINVATLNQ
jgi:hypothetical protein